MIESILYKTAIYCRLSLDDGSLGESGSIQTQKMMLEKYCKDNNYTIKEIYIDDGVSGLTFERSGFQRMLKDIEAGKINMVITKDLSRLGRDYLQTGYYTEQYFPLHNVRYIAVNDGVDTLIDNNDIAPFKNILNDMYAKDLSRKVKSAKRQRYTFDNTDAMLTDRALNYIKLAHPDFVFLYMVETDEKGGHDNGWMTEPYLKCIHDAINNVKRVIEETNGEYTVIVTADHGGHDRAHGSDMDEDMTIPMIFYGKEFKAGECLSGVSILDLAPTIAKIMGVPKAPEWEGKELV